MDAKLIEILKLEDLNDLKKARGVSKSKITITCKILKPVISVQKDGKLKLEELDDDFVEENLAKLDTAWKELNAVNDRILELADGEEKETDAAVEYISSVSVQMSEIRSARSKYNKLKELAIKSSSLLSKIDQKKLELDVLDPKSSEDWTCKTKDLDANALKDLEVMFDYKKEINRVDTTFGELLDLVTTLKEAYAAAALDSACVEQEIGFSITALNKQKTTYLRELERVMLAQDKIHSVSISSSESTTSDAVTPVVVQSVKIKAREALRFSGKAEDFAAFQKEFKALVVPGRSAADIAATLKDSAPKKHQHLFINCEATDWTSMLDIMQRELAPTRDIVNNVRATLKRIKPIDKDDKKADQKFVDMVDTLMKIKRDLTEVKN